MEFLKSVLKWASIWTAILVGLILANDLAQGRPIEAASVLLVAVILWIVMAGLVTFSKVMSAARRVGTNIGRAAVRNPKQDAGAAVGKAVQDALKAPGKTDSQDVTRKKQA